MAEIFAVIGSDARQRYIADGLRWKGYAVETFGISDLPDTKDTLQEAVARAKYVILPMLGGVPEAVAACASPDAILFCGTGTGKENIVEYSKWDSLAIANAVPTAEGAIQLAMEQLPCTLFGSRFLVIGAGRIGLCLAQKLAALGAKVTVTARKDSDLAKIRSFGLTADRTGRYARGLRQYAGIFNTVPATVLDRAQLCRLNPDCVLFELASAPGGFSAEDCEAAGRTYIFGGGLPGRVAPKTAGEIILEEILSYLGRSAWNNL